MGQRVFPRDRLLGGRAMDRSRIVALVVLAGIGTACARTPEPGEAAGAPAPDPASVAGATASARTAADLGIDLGDPQLVLGAPIRAANLLAWPILAEVPDAPPTEEGSEYLTLDAALDSGAAQVLETGDVNELALEAPKTKLLATKLKEYDLSNVLILNEAFDEKLFLAARNLPDVGICDVASMDPVVLIRFEKVLVTVPALKLIEERLS